MIPEAAVEAAARAYYERDGSYWEDSDADWREVELGDFRAALEAAAPHLMADAWDEGYQGCFDRYMYEPLPANPYRTAK